MIESFFTGLLATTLLFFLCFFLCLGIRFTYCYVKNNKSNTNAKKTTRKRTYAKKQQPPQTPQPIRSIEINPNEVDRIYVKKSS